MFKDWDTIGLVLWFSLIFLGIICIIIVLWGDKIGRAVRKRSSDWEPSAGGRSFRLFPEIRVLKHGSRTIGKETFWLWWVWYHPVKTDLFEEILEGDYDRDDDWDRIEGRAVRRRRRRDPTEINYTPQFNNVFGEDSAGFGVFGGGSLVGWALQLNTLFEMRTEPLDVTNVDTPGGYREFIAGFQNEVNIEAKEFHLNVLPDFMEGRTMTAIVRMPSGTTYTTDVRFHWMQSGVQQNIVTIQFRGTGAMIQT